MDELIRHASEIISEASKSQRALLALMILVLGVLAFFFFRDALERTRIAIFVLMLALAASFGVATFGVKPRGPEPIIPPLTPPPVAKGSPSPGTQPATVVVKVRSEPLGAEVYLDWKLKGEAPLSLDGKEISGLLVVMKDGYRAGFRRIDIRKGGQEEFRLLPEGAGTRARLLLLGSQGASSESISSLRGRLVAEGFTILGPQEAEEFQQELGRARGLSHRGLRAWARARFDTDLLVTARFRQSGRELSEQELGYLGIREAVKGAVRAEVGIDLEVVDLRSGDHLAAVSGKGSSFALDRAESFQKALTQAATDSAKLLRQQIRSY